MLEVPINNLANILVVMTLCSLVVATIHSSIDKKLEKILEEIIRSNGKNS